MAPRFVRGVTLAALLAAALTTLIWFRLGPRPHSRPPVAEPRIIGRFETDRPGALIATPWVTTDRIYLAAVRDTGLQPTGAVFCLDRATLNPIWSFDDDGAMLHMFSSPTIADGRLYVGEGMHANFTCRLYCLDAASGRRLWDFTAGSHVESTPVVAAGRVFVGLGDDGVGCLDAATGQRIWRLETPAHVDATPVVAGGVVYAGSGVSRRNSAEPAVYALDAETGRTRWRTAMSLPVWATPTFSDGALFVGLGNGRLLEPPRPPEQPAGALVALDAATGAERWRFSECDAVFGAPAADRERVYFGSRDGQCYALERANGRRAWTVPCGSPIIAGPVWAESTLVIAASGGQLWGLDPGTGTARWKWSVPQPPRTQPRVLAPPAVHHYNGSVHIYLATELQRPNGHVGLMYILEAPH